MGVDLSAYANLLLIKELINKFGIDRPFFNHIISIILHYFDSTPTGKIPFN